MVIQPLSATHLRARLGCRGACCGYDVFAWLDCWRAHTPRNGCDRAAAALRRDRSARRPRLQSYLPKMECDTGQGPVAVRSTRHQSGSRRAAYPAGPAGRPDAQRRLKRRTRTSDKACLLPGRAGWSGKISMPGRVGSGLRARRVPSGEYFDISLSAHLAKYAAQGRPRCLRHPRRIMRGPMMAFRSYKPNRGLDSHSTVDALRLLYRATSIRTWFTCCARLDPVPASCS